MMESLDCRKSILISLFLFIILGLSGGRIAADTLIYNNTSLEGGYYPPWEGSSGKLLDFGTSTGGNVVKFTFGLYTALSNPGTVTIRFYRFTDSSTCPGTLLKTFTISGLSGYGTHIEDFVIPIQDQFTLSSGDFGYSYQFTNSSTGPFVASGGTGNENHFWEWAYDTFWGWDWFLTSFVGGDPWGGFYMKVYTGIAQTGKSTIEGYKFDDADQDGTWDPEEFPLSDWTMYLDINDNGQYDGNDPNAITDSEGHYIFSDLEPDTYKVAEVLQAGWVQTLPGGDGTYTVTVAADEVSEDNNFGNGLTSGYCAAQGGCEEYITDVQVGTINNVGTGCDGYADYTAMSTIMEPGIGYTP